MYANCIIDISHESVDRVFQYRIPDHLLTEIRVGVPVYVPFGAGNKERKAYVVEITEIPAFAPERTKEITDLVARGIQVTEKWIALAWWMKEHYGSTMNQALKTVLPVKKEIRHKQTKYITTNLSQEELALARETAERKHYQARVRLLSALQDNPVIPMDVVENHLNIAPASLKPMEASGLIRVESERNYRMPEIHVRKEAEIRQLTPEQDAVVKDFTARYDAGIRETSLIHGVTGSGKTEVYMEMIRHVLKQRKQVIVLIPEIALTYQTVMRFYRNFKDQVSFVNSRMAPGEKYDQFDRAARGEISVMIGPRSALFTPFEHLGLIVIDEEHEGAYKSETAPRYHARETAIQLAALHGASVVLGSATPSLEAYSRAKSGEYRLYELTKRAKEESRMAEVSVVDLREELKEGNRSIFSRRLQAEMEGCMERGEQIMLFLNRRGYSNFISCRSCGGAIKCPHCDVTLTLHFQEKLVCHYCGYEMRQPSTCPTCGSSYLAGFGIGTQKIEEAVKKMYPKSRVLRMDMDTTAKKGEHEEILNTFASGEADILIGTQMIVKGHDFPNVTLVGILAADLSLYSTDFRCGERTFALLTQAAGRAGRDRKPGNVIIQTYAPEHYSIESAAKQDYRTFYDREMAYRQALHYPPACRMLVLFFSCEEEELLDTAVNAAANWVKEQEIYGLEMIGPAQAPIYRVNDTYRKILYLKHGNYDILIELKNTIDLRIHEADWYQKVQIQFDFS